MKDTELFTELLGITEPWFIEDINLDRNNKRVDIFINHRPGIKLACPKCGEQYSIYDHCPERVYQHLNTCQMETFVHIRLPRTKCKTHGVKHIVSGIGEDNSSMTYEFESYILDLEHECSIQSVSRLTNLDWHRCWHVVEKAVKRGLSRKEHKIPERICIDEKSFGKGHNYETLVYNYDKGCVEFVVDNREQVSLEAYYKQFSYKERKQVKAIAMDMWDPYIAATKAYIPNAEKKIVFDKFHIMQHVLKAVDTVRKEEHKALQQDKIDLLKGSKYLWLRSYENLPLCRKDEFESLREYDLKVCRAWAIKENIRHMWNYHYEKWMRKFFADWYFWATHSQLTPIIKAAKTLKSHIDNIVTYARLRVTNGLAEGLNRKIEKVKRMACGYRNRDNYKTAIYFHCGGLSLYPKRDRKGLQLIMR